MRLFVAVRPPDAVLDHLDLAVATARRTVPGTDPQVRWSARETWHLTCAFYGEVPDGAVPALDAGLGALAAGLDPWTLHLRGAGVFSHRTVWVGAGGDLEPHRRAVEGCRSLGEDLGLAADARERQRPHLTVGRVRPGSGPPRGRGRRPGPDGRPGRGGPGDPGAALVHALAVYEGPAWEVDALLLVASRPGAGRGGGPLYTDVGRYPVGRYPVGP